MSSYFCNKTVQDGNCHCCSFYENDEFFYHLRQLDDILELNTNRDETTAKHAASFDDKNGNSRETAQKIGNSSQASTSLVHSDSFIGNKELHGGSFGESADSADLLFAQDASFQFFERPRILDAGADQPLEMGKVGRREPGTSTIHHQTRGPDGMKVYVCDKCSYQSKNKSNFNRHYKKHTGEKNHVCETCGKRFSRKGHLNSHKRLHRGEKPFSCDICEKHFAQKSTLDSHLRMHTGEWPYKCEKCGKGFSYRGHLDIHLRSHSGERPFECSICKRRFPDQNSLRRHGAIHGQKPYRCKQCGRTFRSNGDRNRHIMQQHP